MIRVANIIAQVRETSSKLDKERVLHDNKDYKLLGDVLHFIFNPYLKTNIATKKLSKKVSMDAITSIASIEDYMNYLKQSTGKDEHIATVQNYINSQPEEIHWLLEAMATKTLKIGATSSTINKVYGEGFIPTFDVMLAEKYIETKKVKGVSKVYEHWKRYLGQRVIATKKLDGNRCVVFTNDDGSVQLFSREGHLMEGYVEIEKVFKEFPRGLVFDGEILAINEEGLNSQDLFKKTSKIVKKKGIKDGLEFHAFDLVPIKKFVKGMCEVACERRKEMLNRVVDTINHPLVKYVKPLYIGEFDKDIVDKLADDAKNNLEEGIMVQLADAPYECKRTFSILKVKSFESCDIRCVDVYEGKTGKNIGRLGGLVLDFKGHLVNVGGGFSDEQRIAIWQNKDSVLGKIVEIQYFEEFEDEDGKIDLRFATFKTIRDDKSEPSYY